MPREQGGGGEDSPQERFVAWPHLGVEAGWNDDNGAGEERSGPEQRSRADARGPGILQKTPEIAISLGPSSTAEGLRGVLLNRKRLHQRPLGGGEEKNS